MLRLVGDSCPAATCLGNKGLGNKVNAEVGGTNYLTACEVRLQTRVETDYMSIWFMSIFNHIYSQTFS